ncbi:MAG TPA: aconitate hydratase [Chthoniobacteraceae bacterium]|jgi:aconitate hydratase|nr:aconitate hydratase [Chthoniobacteraceae bacterium]
MSDPFQTLQQFDLGNGKQGSFHSLPALEQQGIGPISRLPISIRIVLESVLRNCDGKKVTEADVHTLANWNAKAPKQVEIPFVVARVILQDFTGVPLLVDLAAMRSTVARLGRDPKMIEPLVPVDLVVDHSVQVDFFGSPAALNLNMDLEFKRNRERYQLLKWGQQAFSTFGVVPPGIGIVHQVNLEYLAKGVLEREGVYFPDTLVGTDSHTTMINGLGVVGWGVGGIEAEAGMLGQPVYFLTPEVVGVHLTGALSEGVTATDLVLHITQMLRKAKVVGKFVEFYGPGARSLPVVDRATIGNMAPEYGATMGFFGVDEETLRYLVGTGRPDELCAAFEAYYKAQGLWGIPQKGEIDYSVDLELDLTTVVPAVAGPRRPQDHINLPDLKSTFTSLFTKAQAEGGYGKTAVDLAARVAVHINGETAAGPQGLFSTDAKSPEGHMAEGAPQNVLEMVSNRPTPHPTEEISASPYRPADTEIGHGSVLIAAITSCTNTSNPSVMLGAGLLAKKAVERGLKVNPAVKTSLGPGSRVVTDYLTKTGLQNYLDQLGFQTVGYGCTTCIGNSGPLHPALEEAITEHDLVAASVLSGNRNFEARVHQNIKANFLMSPPLVVAFALAGRVDIDLTTEPIGKDKDHHDVYLRDLWPSLAEVRDAMASALSPEVFRTLYSDFANQNPKWNEIPASTGDVYAWDDASTYIQEPPFFTNFSMEPGNICEINGARPLGIFGDSVTTDHISPAGAIKKTAPAGTYLVEHGVPLEEFNSYGSRRGNDRVMTRGTFANVRIKNLMAPGTEGGVTRHQPEGTVMSIYDASIKYQASGIPLIIFAGQEYGTGSSRDWAAKGTRLLGVKAVVAQSFERIHRSNLVGMGVLPLQFSEGATAQTLGLDGSETFDLLGLSDDLKPMSDVRMVIHRADGTTSELTLRCRIDTAIEVDYFRHGGILPFVLRQLLSA